jgi:uncharacterized protein (DUF433 family)
VERERDGDWNAAVWSDRERLGGEVCFRGTRVPVRVLFEYLGSGHTMEQFLDDFEGVTQEQIGAVLRLAGESVTRWSMGPAA